MKNIIVLIVMVLAGFAGAGAIDGKETFESGGLWFMIENPEEADAESFVYLIRPPMEQYYQQEEITVPASVEHDGREYRVAGMQAWVFENCENLRVLRFDLPAYQLIRSVGYCPNLERVEFPSETEIISGFHNCPKLEEVEFPQGLRIIEQNAFIDAGLRRLKFPSGFEEVGFDSFSNTQLEELEFEGVVRIWDDAFRNAGPGFKVVRFPATLRWLYYRAFSDNDLDEVWLQDNAAGEQVRIDYGAFLNTSVKRIYCNCRIVPGLFGPIRRAIITDDEYDPSSGEPPYVFPFKKEDKGISTITDLKSITLYVPQGCREEYAGHLYWGNFTIEEYDFSASVAEVEIGGGSAVVRAADGGLAVGGLADGCVVRVFTAAGRLAGQARANGDGNAFIRLPEGFYVVDAGGVAVKAAVR